MIRPLPAFVSLLVLALAAPAIAAPLASRGWASYEDQRYGYSIAYPKAVFRPIRNGPNRDGRIFVSPDAKARLLVGAVANETGQNMRDYRAFVLRHSYAGAEILYAPIRANFFVLSGRRDGVHFYERVSFTCNGDVINSWAMVYPDGERQFYDGVVEAVAKTYRPGSRTCR